jgi:nitrogen fixation NifU-like protein
MAPTVVQEGSNVACGDRVRLELAIHGDVVTAARFTASACAICVAASSVVTELVRAAPLEDIATLTVDEVIAALATELPRGRLDCVRLPLTVLHTALWLHERRARETPGRAR